MKVLLDTNIVLDVLQDRKPFVAHATEIFSLVEHSQVTGFLSATTITTIDYILSQSMERKVARAHLSHLLNLFAIAPVNRPVIEQALRSPLAAFEDAVLEQSALLAGADAIITRNTRDFTAATIKVLDPGAFLAIFRA